MKNTGIKLGLDNDGNSIIIQKESQCKCVADMFCQYAQRNEAAIICNLKQPADVFAMERCPNKKWHSYLNVKTEVTKITGCFCCRSHSQWRIKDKWVCENCHPPPFENVERREYDL